MVRTQVQLTDEQARAIKRLAAERRVSMAELIRECVDAFLRSTQATPEAELRARALRAAGALRGPSDLARRHDDHAAEAFGR